MQVPKMRKTQTIVNLVNTLSNIDLQDEEDTDDEIMQSCVHMVRSRIPVDPPSEEVITKFYPPPSTGTNPHLISWK